MIFIDTVLDKSQIFEFSRHRHLGFIDLFNKEFTSNDLIGCLENISAYECNFSNQKWKKFMETIAYFDNLIFY